MEWRRRRRWWEREDEYEEETEQRVLVPEDEGVEGKRKRRKAVRTAHDAEGKRFGRNFHPSYFSFFATDPHSRTPPEMQVKPFISSLFQCTKEMRPKPRSLLKSLALNCGPICFSSDISDEEVEEEEEEEEESRNWSTRRSRMKRRSSSGRRTSN